MAHAMLFLFDFTDLVFCGNGSDFISQLLHSLTQFLFRDVCAEFYYCLTLLKACFGIDLIHTVQGVLNAVLAIHARHRLRRSSRLLP